MEQGWPGLAQYIPAVPADWSPRPRTVQDALDQLAGRAGGAGVAASFVYRPGGVAAPGVYVTSAALLAAVSSLDTGADKVVAVDASLAAVPGTAHIGGGPWPDNITWQSAAASTLSVLVLDEGTSFAGIKNVRFRNIVVTPNNATTILTVAAGASATITLEGLAVLEPTGAGNIVADVAGILDLVLVLSEVGDGTAGHAMFAVEATGTMNVDCFDASTFAANTVKQGAAPGGALSITFDGASQANVSTTQVPAPTLLNVDPQPTFVLKPGATSLGGANVFTTWSALMAAAALSPGAKTIAFDSSVAQCHVTAGNWNVDQVSFVLESPLSLAANPVICDSGAHFTFSTIHLYNDVRFELAAGAASPLITCAAGVTQFIDCLQGEFRSDEPTQPIISVPSGATLSMYLRAHSALGGGGNTALSIAAGGTSSIRAYDQSLVNTGAIVNAGTSTVTATAGVTLNGQAATFADLATQIDYTSTGSDAACNFKQASANTGTGTGTVSAVTGNIAKKRTGFMNVAGVVSGVISGAGTVTVSLLRDATPIGHSVPYVALATATGFAISVNFIDTAPDTANHTYTVQAVASAGTIATAANGAQIEVIEL